MYWNDGGGWWMWIPMTLFALAWIVGAFLVVQAIMGRGGDEAPRPSARELLDARLARGELGREEYLALRAALDGDASPGEPAGAGAGETRRVT